MRFVLALTLLATSVFAQAQQVNYEAGADWSNSEAGGPALVQAVSGMLRVSDLRAYYGLRLAASSESRFGSRPLTTSPYRTTYTALATYKSFPFDLEGDCDCPTWGKESWLQKHLFVEAGLGGAFVHEEDFVRDLPNGEVGGPEDRYGAAYLLRTGLSVQVVKRFEVFLAGSVNGVVHKKFSGGAGEVESGLMHTIGVQAVLGLTYRWPTRAS